MSGDPPSGDDATIDTGVPLDRLAEVASAPEGDTVRVGDLVAHRYLVTALLGHGGMGEVYQVHDQELDEEVALKLLRSELSRDPAYRQRLRGEVRLARRVSHPNVCRVHDLGQHHDHLFVTMELVRGRTLRRVLRDLGDGTGPPMPLAVVVDVIVQLCSALAAAHRAGVLHRDVKPDNVILEDGRAVLTDFGVAIQLGEGPGRVVAGTPSYVAPEILRGEPFDHRADVYAAAVVAYELIAGRAPHPTRTMSAALRRAVEQTPAPPLPSSVGPPALRAALDAVLASGLEIDPSKRLPSVDRLAEGLSAALRGGGGAELAARPRPDGMPDVTPPTPTTGLRRRELRVATVLRFECDAVPRTAESTLAVVTGTASGGAEPTQIVPIELPGDDLERLVVSLGGLPLHVDERSLTALFGAPVALGDDAVRAVRAARTLVARTVGGRAGLDTVRVMVRPGGSDPVAPEALRHAETLAAVAPPGDVWVTAAAARHVAAHVDVTALPDLPGLSGERTLRVGGDARSSASPADATLVRPRELERLEQLARACFEGRTPTVVEIVGPSGSGKSRLREALIARISQRREVDWLVARAAPLGEAAPLSLLRTADAAWADSATRGGPADRGATLNAARRWVEDRAARRPVAIVFEDVQWADELSRALIAHLAANLDALPVLVVTFARDEGLAAVPNAQRIALAPLDDATALRLARDAAPGASDDALADVVARAGGNPYFVEELARDVAERGPNANLPSTVEAAVQARLDRLSTAASEVVTAAAVVGRAFWREAMRAALTTPVDEADVDAALAELERRGLVHPAPPATVDDDRYEFGQAIVRDVAYARLPSRDRRRAHAEVARWLEHRAGGLRSTDPDVLLAIAHHREHGGDREGAAAAWRVAGTRCLELFAAKQAHAALGRAWELGGRNDPALAMQLGDAALESDGPAAATEAYRAALALTPEGSPDRARIHFRLAEAASHAADHQRSIAEYELGLTLVDESPAARGLGPRAREAREDRGSTQEPPEAASLAAKSDDPRLASALAGGLGWVLAYQLSSPDPRGLALCERAVALLEGTPHKRELAKALSRLGGAYMRAGRWTEQLACNRRNLEIAQELGDLPGQITARINLGVVLGNLGEVDAAIAHTEEALLLCRRTGRRAVEGLCANNLAGYLLERGDLDAADRWLGDAIKLLERTGSRRVLPESHTFATRIAARRGDLPAALACARTALELSRELQLGFDTAVALRLLAQVEARRGDLSAAREALAESAKLLEGADPFELARIDAAWARVHARAGDTAAAAEARLRAATVFDLLGARLDRAALDDPDDVR